MHSRKTPSSGLSQNTWMAILTACVLLLLGLNQGWFLGGDGDDEGAPGPLDAMGCPLRVGFRSPRDAAAPRDRVLLYSYPGSGSSWLRLAPVTARARSLPLLTSCRASCMAG